jgi:hypothetical protein
MTKGDQVYTTKIDVVMDPRATYTLADRKAQLALALRLGTMLNHMSWAVDAIVRVRDSALADAAKVDAGDPLHAQLVALAASADAIRKEIVATKEGGAITGEERLREYFGDLYGDVAGYDGRPTDEQNARADVLGHQLDDVVAELNKLADDSLPQINSKLKAKKLDAIEVPGEAEWQKNVAESGQQNGAVQSSQAARGRRVDND